VVVGVLLGVIVGRKLLPWFVRRRPILAYAILIVLVMLSIGSFPAIFPYGLSQ
jgi:hypothetical protein